MVLQHRGTLLLGLGASPLLLSIVGCTLLVHHAHISLVSGAPAIHLLIHVQHGWRYLAGLALIVGSVCGLQHSCSPLAERSLNRSLVLLRVGVIVGAQLVVAVASEGLQLHLLGGRAPLAAPHLLLRRVAVTTLI